MAITFPTSLDNFTNPTGSQSVAAVDHAGMHSNLNDAIEALEAKVGVDSSAVVTSHDYLITNLKKSLAPAGVIPYITNDYQSYTNRGLCPLLSTDSPLADLIYTHPIYINRSMTVDAFRMTCTAAAGTPGEVCFGIYSNLANGFYPDALIYGGTSSDKKTVSATNIDVKAASGNWTPSANTWYWFAAIWSHGSNTFMGANTSTGFGLPSTTVGRSMHNNWVKSQAWSSGTPLPTSFGSGSTSTWGQIFQTEFRFAS